VGMRMSSKKRLGFFKKNGTDLMAYMRAQDIWLVAHKHKTMIVQRVGFVVGKCPDHTNKHVYEKSLKEELEKFMNKDKKQEEKCKAPTFEVVKSKVVHPIKDAKGKVTRKIHTFALEIKCEKNRTRFLRDLMYEADLDTRRFGRFIPYAMKWRETTYAQAVSLQNAFLHESSMIPIFGLHEEVLEEVVEGKTILKWALDGTIQKKSHYGRDINVNPIESIERTNRTKTLSKWKLMTKKSLEEQASAIFDRTIQAKGSRTKAHRKAVELGQCYSYGIRRSNVKLQLGNTMENCATNLENWLQEETSDLIAEPPQKRGGFSLVFDQNQFPELQTTEDTREPVRLNAWQRRDETRETNTVGGRSEQTGTDNGSQAMSHATVQTVLTHVFEQMDKRMADMAENNKQSTERLIGQMNKSNERNAKGLGKMQRMCEQQQAITMTLTMAMAGLLTTMGPAAEGIAKQLEPMLQQYKELAEVIEHDQKEEEDEEDEEMPMKASANTTRTNDSRTTRTTPIPADPTREVETRKEDTRGQHEISTGPTATEVIQAQLKYTHQQLETVAASTTEMDTSEVSRKRSTEERSLYSDNRSRGTTKMVVTPGPSASRVEMRNRKGQRERETSPSVSNVFDHKQRQRSKSKSKERKKMLAMDSLDPTLGGLVHTASSNDREVDRQNYGGDPRKQD
jgi:hypothetical protein